MQTVFLLSLGALIVVCFCGCDQAPKPPMTQTKATPSPADELVIAGAGAALPAETPETSTQVVEPDVPQPTPLQPYRNPQAQAAVQEYTNRWQKLQQDGQAGTNLGAVNPLTNPGAISAYANQIGADTTRLEQAEKAARGLMDPQEKKRFKIYQKELTQPDSGD